MTAGPIVLDQVAAGLPCGNVCQSSGNSIQSWRCDVQIAIRGDGGAVSKQPIETPKRPGRISSPQNTVVPHCGQNELVTVRPLSPVRAHVVAVPSILTASREKNAPDTKADPVRF